MAGALKTGFSTVSAPTKGVLIVFAGPDVKFGKASQTILQPLGDLVARAAEADSFKGKKGQVLDLIAPHGLKVSRLIVIGTGNPSDLKQEDVVKLGGSAFGRIPASTTDATLIADFSNGPASGGQAADMALGATLRAYSFDRYKTKLKDGDSAAKDRKLTIGVSDPDKARKAFVSRQAIADGVIMARDLVNEPANILYPEEFAERTLALKKVGVKVEILDMAALKRLKMNALLGVGQGSVRESRVVIMRWDGGKKNAKPLAFIGKGVCFDTGGISIKPASGMEDMKGDMAGAACVVGLMHALAARKAKVNAVGAIGLVENMPDGNAQRPGDIVTSMSGQTIEIINTDAEGRLVLGDVLWHVNKKFQPEFMIDLATLTGAIIVALGQEYAGLFSNNDKLSERLIKAGQETGERVWRMPLGPEYDKLIDSQFADMKNTGGRYGGSITAAQFLQRFVDDIPWAHLDIAGTAMGAPKTDINQSWGSGYGVRLLDRLVAD
ncbi:MAG: leucyl aminopeptidase, partial [Pseudorhodoplanes sp.]